MMGVLDSREWAAVTWLVIGFGWAMTKPDLRKSFADVGRAALAWKIVLAGLVLAAWTVGAVWLAWRIGLWEGALAKDTAFWFAIGGVPLIASMDAAGKDGFLRGVAKKALAFAVAIEFIVALFPFHYGVELVLLPVITFIALMGVVVERDPEHAAVKRVVDWVLVIFGVALFAHGLDRLHSDWGDLDGSLEVMRFALPIWLAAAALPLAYVYSIVGGYEVFYMRVRFHRDDRRVPLRVRLGSFIGLGLRARYVWNVRLGWLSRFAEASGFREALQVARDFKRHTETDRDAEKQRLQRLRDNAGVEGMDEGGRQLDRRGFKEAKSTLVSLRYTQQGWHNASGEYHRDAAIFHSADDESVQLSTTLDGQSYRAWITTPSGFSFAVAANADDPAFVSFCAGQGEPPDPCDDPGQWHHEMDFDQPVDWTASDD